MSLNSGYPNFDYEPVNEPHTHFETQQFVRVNLREAMLVKWVTFVHMHRLSHCFSQEQGFKDTDEKHGSLPGPAILGMTCLMMKTMHVTKHLAVTNGC